MKLLAPFLILFGILLPVGALVAESGWHFCASAFFDPIPTIWHALAVALVPLSNILAFPLVFGEQERGLKSVSIINTVAVCVSIYYTVLFLPLLPLGAIAILVFGLGFFCYAPLMSCIVSLQVRSKLKAKLREAGKSILPLDVCASALLILAALMGLSANLTRVCEYEIAANKNTAATNILLLRALGDRDVMLRACYGLSDIAGGWAQTMVNWRYAPGPYVYLSEELAREIFYRANGRSFNSFKHPPLTPSDRFEFMDQDWYDYYGDHDFAGDVVGGVVRGLKLANSRIGGEYDPDACVEHLVWTMSFDKEGYESRELRLQLQLPPAAVVSGCWLTVDGVKKDAIFIDRLSARSSYVKQASSGQTGLLVSTAGPGRVLLQAPAINSDLELCVEIDAPMKLLNERKSLITLPSLTERNFEAAATTDVHLLEILKSNQLISELKPLNQALHFSLSSAELFSGPNQGKNAALLERGRNPEKNISIAFNPFNPSTVSVQKITKSTAALKKPLLVVLDGSESMEGLNAEICRCLKDADFDDISLVWASDQPSLLASHLSSKSLAWQNSLARLSDSACVGGQDNAQAINMALQACRQGTDVLWIHGPQAVKLSSANLLAIWTARAASSTLYEYQAAPGPNELIKSLDKCQGIVTLPHSYGLSGDLKMLLEELSGKREVFRIERKLVAKDSGYVVDGPSFLSRLAANDWVRARLPFAREDKANAKVAERYHIVTPLTSAFVKLDVPAPQSPYYYPPHLVSDKLSQLNATQTGASSAGAPAELSKSNETGTAAASSNAAAQTSDAKSPKDASAAEELDPLADLPAESSADINMIPTKPEPPMWLLLACLFLVMAAVALAGRRLKERCS